MATETLTISGPECEKARRRKYCFYDFLLYSYPVVFLFPDWPGMDFGRFVLLLLLALSSMHLVLKTGRWGKNVIPLGLGLLALYSVSTSLLSYFPIVSFLKAFSLLLLAGFLLFMPPALDRLHPNIGAKEYMLRMYLYLAVITVMSNAVYYFINPSSLDDATDLYSTASFLDGRFRGWFSNPNAVGAMYGIYFLPVLWWGIRKQAGRWVRPTLLITLALAGIQLVASQSRAGVLAGFTSLLVLLLGRRKWGLRVMIAGIVGFSTFAVYLENPEGNFIRNFLHRGEAQLEGSDRLPVWHETWNRFLDNPFFGSGIGVSNTSSVPEGLMASSDKYTIEKANSYLGALEELGLAGVTILFAALFLPVLTASWKVFRAASVHGEDANLILVAIVVAGFVNTMFEAWLLSVGSIIGFSFWVFAALLLSSPEGRAN